MRISLKILQEPVTTDVTLLNIIQLCGKRGTTSGKTTCATNSVLPVLVAQVARAQICRSALIFILCQ